MFVAGACACGILVALGGGTAGAVGDPCGPGSNPIVCENSKPGAPQSEWDVAGSGDPTIQGFATDISVNQGQTVAFKVKTDASAYSIDIYRLGWYGGLGARKVASVTPSATLPQIQPDCVSDATTGLVDCGNWAESASWQVPADAVSGIYIALMRRTDTGGTSQIVFVVRSDSSHSDVLLQTSDSTWEAYNRYGGNSLYYGSPAGRAYKVSYNRPFTTRDYEPNSWLMTTEYPMLRWLERNGYDVSYATGVDAARSGAELLQHKLYIASGHDEYWSGQQRANVEAARAAGVNLAFFSGNDVFWKTRFEPSIDGASTPYRTLVTYKETAANAKIDPSPEWTGSWRDPRFSPPADGGRPENALTGQLFTVNSPRDDAITVPGADAKLRLWRNTDVANTPANGVATLLTGSLGYEWDEPVDNGFEPAGIVRFSSTTVDVNSKIKDYGSTFGAGTATHSLTLYKAPSGALVFGAGTVQWAWGLDSVHDGPQRAPDVRMQQATVNLFADMGVQPASMQANLIAATASTDTTAPTSTITFPVTGAKAPRATPVTVTGTATDVGGSVGGVEVSTDGGTTWHPATGTTSWTYTFTTPDTGNDTLVIKSRAVDDSGNLEGGGLGTGPGVTLTVGCPCQIWRATAVPGTAASSDSSSIEVGVKFRSDVAGTIVGIRFYKGAGNGGTHVGDLWTASGRLLARAKFTSETATGWQAVHFAAPVGILANTTYVASYFAPQGSYATDRNGLAAGVDSPPLHALRDGLDGGNGIFSYSAVSTFPSDTYGAGNYWVDVIYDGGAVTGDTTPPQLVTTLPANGAVNVNTGTGLTVSFSESLDPTTINATTFKLKTPAGAVVPSTVTYTAATGSATLQPASGLSVSTTYTATIAGGAAGVKDLAGNALAANVNWSFATVPPAPCPCTLFTPTSRPLNSASSDGHSVEVGVRFRADVAGHIDGIRFYKGTGNNGTHVGNLWTTGGTLLARAYFTNETSSGWQEVRFATPVSVAANTTYVASYFAPQGSYASDRSVFETAGIDSPPLHALRDGADGANGVYRYGSSSVFPTDTYGSSNYWIDVIFRDGATSADTTPPLVLSHAPDSGWIDIPVGSSVTAAFSEALDPLSVTNSTFTLTAPDGASVPAIVTYSAATGSATLTPLASLAPSTNYTATIAGINDLAGNPIAVPRVWSFTTQAVSCPCSLWSTITVPGNPASGDSSSLELGMKFQPDVDGQILGIRFYKGSGNGGTHIGNLWTATGSLLLASATFTGESASGWQEVRFASPVSVTAGSTYVASYFAPQGHYAIDRDWFAAKATDSPPLHALRDGTQGGNGVYRYGAASTFPGDSYGASNYWVDVLFVPSP
jgi:hypothetical protein